jgi:putative heme-binding domain-containing protein
MVTGVNLRRGQFKTAISDEDLSRVLATGRPDAGMPAFASLQPGQVTGVIAFIRAGFDPAATAVKVGDPARGQSVFTGKGACATCHRVNGRGPRVASDLSDIGAIRTAASLQRSLLDPARNLLPANRTMRAVTRDGRTIQGRRLNEDTYTVQLIDEQERLVSLTKADLRSLEALSTSAMPAYGATLGPEELSDVIAYLLSLKGLP